MICNWDEIKLIAAKLKNEGKKIIFTNGVFDIIHYGHVKYLQDAKALGDILVVGLNSDASTKRLKGESRPINNEHDRAFVLSGLRSVDFVVPFEQDTPLDLITIVNPDKLVKGGDYEIKKIVGYDFVTGNGGEVVTIKFEEGRSSSSMIEKINKL